MADPPNRPQYGPGSGPPSEMNATAAGVPPLAIFELMAYLHFVGLLASYPIPPSLMDCNHSESVTVGEWEQVRRWAHLLNPSVLMAENIIIDAPHLCPNEEDYAYYSPSDPRLPQPVGPVTLFNGQQVAVTAVMAVRPSWIAQNFTEPMRLAAGHGPQRDGDGVGDRKENRKEKKKGRKPHWEKKEKKKKKKKKRRRKSSSSDPVAKRGCCLLVFCALWQCLCCWTRCLLSNS